MASLNFILGTLFRVNHCRYFHRKGLLGLIFAGYVPLAYQSLYPLIIDPILVTLGQMLFSQSQFSHYLFMHLPSTAFY